MRLVALVVALLFLSSSCSARDPWVGTYSNANGSITLDVKKGGKASLAAVGDTEECTYTTDGDRSLTLNCPEEPATRLVFTRQSDESIVADNPMVGRLAKSKR